MVATAIQMLKNLTNLAVSFPKKADRAYKEKLGLLVGAHSSIDHPPTLMRKITPHMKKGSSIQ